MHGTRLLVVVAVAILSVVATGFPLLFPPHAASPAPASSIVQSPPPRTQSVATSGLSNSAPSGSLAKPTIEPSTATTGMVSDGRSPGFVGLSSVNIPTATVPRGATGAEFARQSIAQPSGAQSSPVCAGLFPGFPNTSYDQSLYSYDCYGHDEPGIQFYSNLPGSGGNVTWSVTLPIDRSAIDNQSNLYSAIWFGATMAAPSAWLRECFLEVQFYPDAQFVPASTGHWYTAATTTLIGNWVGAVYAWQIEAATDREIPCYYTPLFPGGHSGPAYFSMTQGDHVSVTMTGWPGSSTGENLTIIDNSNGQTSYVTMFNSTGNYPVDPAYQTNSWENALHWTPGGEYPVAFAFETGHAGNPSFPNTNQYGGCNPGPPGFGNNATPCPSYDPASWANDTLVPWHISPPVFFNSAGRQTPAQVAFTSPGGGIDLISTLDGGTCSGRTGSSWCTYPWYSYSCAAQAFEFGATDYPGVSDDFGQFNEYATSRPSTIPGLYYYPPLNFSLPSCGGASYTVTLTPNGAGSSIYFLSTDYNAQTNISGVAPGNYSIFPISQATGAHFQSWVTTGGVRIEGAQTNPWASLDVQGDGSVSAQFGSSVVDTTVRFLGAGPSGAAALLIVSPGNLYSTGVPIATVNSGRSVLLPPGIYGVQAGYPSGTNFSYWAANDNGVIFAAAYFPYTTLVVTGTQSNVTITATSTATTSTATAEYGSTGGGAVSFDGVSTTSVNILLVPPGTYPVIATPNPGYRLLGWGYSVDAFLTDFQSSTNASVYRGTSLIEAFFLPVPYNVSLEVLTLPGTSGAVNVVAAPVSITLTNGQAVTVASSSFVQLSAISPAGDNFTGWSTNASATLWILDPTTALGYAVFNATMVKAVSITAHFTAAPTAAVTFSVTPSAGGWILFNVVNNYTGGLPTVTNSSVSIGTYAITFVPAPGWEINNSGTSGRVSIIIAPFGAVNLNVSGAGDVNVSFIPVPPTPTPAYAVSFVANSPVGASGTINGTAVASGASVVLPAGAYPLSVVLSRSNQTFVFWSPGPGLSVLDPNATSTQLTVSGPGTIYAIVAPFGVTPPMVSRNPTEVGVSVAYVTTVIGAGPVTIVWRNLPGCSSGNVVSLTCNPTSNGTFDVTVVVTDAAGQTALGTVRSVVNPHLSVVSFTASSTSFVVGDNTTFLTLPIGGVWPLTYTYSGLPGGCTSANTSSLFCKPSSAGTYTITVRLVDTLGVNATTTLSITVNSPSGGPILGLQPAVFYGILAVVLVVLGVIIAAALLSRRRKPAPTTSLLAEAPLGASGAPVEPIPATPLTPPSPPWMEGPPPPPAGPPTIPPG